MRAQPEDFVVEEIPAYAPSGEGDHTFVLVEKRLRTTEEVARALARAAGAKPRDVGYAGRKDRVAVARQWLSVQGLDPSDALALELPGVRVLEACAHPHKLRTGHLRGNRFELVVRELDEQAFERAAGGVEALRRTGLPNRFGDQRFGRDGDNAERARALLAGGRPPREKREARFLLSALQAAVFNRVLEERPLPLHELERGDLAQKHDSGGVFLVDDVDEANARAARFEISPTGPIFGTRATQPEGAVAEREAAALDHFQIPDPESLSPPRGLRLRGARRALRVPVTGLLAEPGAPESDALRLCFELPPGSYASVLIEELVGPVHSGAG